MDNPFDIPASGQADWDAGLSQDLYAIERGYHITERAGQVVSSGQVLTLNSGGFFFPYNPASTSIAPHAYAYTAAASGDSLTALAWGIVRSLDINSPAVPGKLAYATASGFLSTAVLGLPVGVFTTGRGVLFNPDHAAGGGGGGSLGALTDVNTTGLLNNSILKWSDATSKWVIAVDSAGGGGVDPTSLFTGIASGGAGFDGRFSFGTTITASNVLATPLSSSPYNHIMAQPAKMSGKRYYEFIPGGTSFTNLGIVGPAGHTKAGDGNPLGEVATLFGQIGVQPGGTVKANGGGGVKTIATVGAWTASVWVGFAIDIDARLMWVRVNTAGTWNNSATCDPSSGTGGIDLTWALADAGASLFWPAMNAGNTNTHALYVRSADIGARIPPAFSAWDS